MNECCEQCDKILPAKIAVYTLQQERPARYFCSWKHLAYYADEHQELGVLPGEPGYAEQGTKGQPP